MTVSEQCEKTLLAMKEEEKGGMLRGTWVQTLVILLGDEQVQTLVVAKFGYSLMLRARMFCFLTPVSNS